MIKEGCLYIMTGTLTSKNRPKNYLAVQSPGELIRDDYNDNNYCN